MVKFLRVGLCRSYVSDIVNEQVCVKHVSYLHFLHNYFIPVSTQLFKNNIYVKKVNLITYPSCSFMPCITQQFP